MDCLQEVPCTAHVPVCAPFARVWRPIHVLIWIASHVTVPFNVREIVARPILKHKSPIMDKLRHAVGPSSLIDAFNSILKFVGASSINPCTGLTHQWLVCCEVSTVQEVLQLSLPPSGQPPVRARASTGYEACGRPSVAARGSCTWLRAWR